MVDEQDSNLIQYYPSIRSFTFYPKSKSELGTHTVQVVLTDSVYQSAMTSYQFWVRIVPPMSEGGANLTNKSDQVDFSNGMAQVNTIDFYINTLNNQSSLINSGEDSILTKDFVDELFVLIDTMVTGELLDDFQ